jgi:hypothetical protein
MHKGGTGRRTLLQRGLALLAGGVAVAAGARTVQAEQPAALKLDPIPRPQTLALTLYARKRPIARLPGAARGGHAAEARTQASGELLASPEGSSIGSFYTNCFCMGTPLGAHTREASNLEFQVLELKDGTLFGLCGGAAISGVKAHAIVGGTGAYAGARGSYVERAVAETAAVRDVIELVVTLAG